MRAVLCLVAVLASGVAARGDSPYYARMGYQTFGERYGFVAGRAATYWSDTNEIELMAWIHEFDMPTPPLPASRLKPFYFLLYHTTPERAPIADFDSVEDVPWKDIHVTFVGEISREGSSLSATRSLVEWNAGSEYYDGGPMNPSIEFSVVDVGEFHHQLNPRQNFVLDKYGIPPTAVWSARFSFDELRFPEVEKTAFQLAYAVPDSPIAKLVNVDRVRANVIPEPASVALAAVGVVALIVHRLRARLLQHR